MPYLGPRLNVPLREDLWPLLRFWAKAKGLEPRDLGAHLIERGLVELEMQKRQLLATETAA